MSTANAILAQPRCTDNYTQNEAPPNTGLHGVAPGKYQVYLNGQYIDTVYAADHNAAYPEFHKLLNEYRSIPVYRGDNLVTTIDWCTCPHCGKSVDVGAECPKCAGELIFAGGIEWEVSQ